MPLHRELDLLVPEMREKVDELIKRIKFLKLPYAISETYREQAVQDAYYAQGRKKLFEVNQLRQAAKLPLITEKENKIITMATKSQHTLGRAIDIVGLVNGNLSWNMPMEFWRSIAFESKTLGLDPGYYWLNFKDLPHHQLK